jgi:hypothetical protein
MGSVRGERPYIEDIVMLELVTCPLCKGVRDEVLCHGCFGNGYVPEAIPFAIYVSDDLETEDPIPIVELPEDCCRECHLSLADQLSPPYAPICRECYANEATPGDMSYAQACDFWLEQG